MKNPLIILTGPTAVGKTALSINLAKAVNGEIISADSMQIYKEMNIGTAKILPEEMQGVPHFLVDELNPDEEFNVTVFQKKAKLVEYLFEECERRERRSKLSMLESSLFYMIFHLRKADRPMRTVKACTSLPQKRVQNICTHGLCR